MTPDELEFWKQCVAAYIMSERGYSDQAAANAARQADIAVDAYQRRKQQSVPFMPKPENFAKS